MRCTCFRLFTFTMKKISATIIFFFLSLTVCSASLANTFVSTSKQSLISANTATWDIDGDGRTDALTDGLLFLRYQFDFRGDTLINGAVASGASRTTASAIEARLAEINANIGDIDGNGRTDALTDGLLLLRYLFNFRGSTLINGAIGSGATRSNAANIEERIGSSTITPTTNPAQSQIEIIDWYLSVPSDNDNNGRSDRISETMLDDGYQDGQYYFLNSDNSIVFRCPIDGAKTSTNTSYTRSELREMLRRGNTSHSTQGVNKNNWVFSSAPVADQNAAGGIDGTMTASVAVNHVTTTGSSSQVGRVIIGQIHANDDEPVRLYYRKLPANELGSIYFAHEPLGRDDVYYEMIGSRSRSAPNPVDGIALNERFDYQITVVGNTLTVTISRVGKPDITQVVDMSGSGYDQGGQYMYFKAGVYNQNNTGDDDDYVQATFYSIKNSHRGYLFNE